MSAMPLTVDVSCIKNEKVDEEEEVEVKWSANNFQSIKIKTEIDIGPIKLEENVYNNIKPESPELELLENTAEKASKETESRNRREDVRVFHQRIVELDLKYARKKQKLQNKPSASPDTRKDHSLSNQSPGLSNSEHMRDLRQRLMKLENPITPSSSKPARTCSQMRRQLEERLMKLDMMHSSKSSKEPQQTAIVPAGKAPKTSAQCMQELRQRRREEQAKSSNVPPKQSHNKSTNTRQLEERLMQPDMLHNSKRSKEPQQTAIVPVRKARKTSAQCMRELRQRRREQQAKSSNVPYKQTRPPTPPELSVSRMREFRQRILNLDKSLEATNVKSRRSQP